MKNNKKTETSLQESERKFRETVKHLDEGYYSVTIEGLLIDHNQAFNRILGFDADQDLRGVQLPDFWQNDGDRNVYLKELIEKGKISKYRINAKKNDGEKIVVLANAHLVKDKNEKIERIDGTFTDFTKLILMEEALKESENKYRSLFENSPVGMYHTKIDGSGIIEINNSACEMLGFKKEELIGQPSAIRWADPNRRGEILKIMGEHGVATNFDADVLKKDGTILSCLLSMKIYKEKDYIEGFIVDISERKRAEAEVRLQSEIMSHMADAVYLIRMDDGVIVYTNSRFEELFGYERGELLGKHVSIVNAPTEKNTEETAKEIMNILAEKGFWKGEVNNITKHGTTFWSYASVTIFDHLQFGKVLVAVHLDITERKRAEEALLASEKRFRITADSLIDVVYEWDLKEKIEWFGDIDGIMGYPYNGFPRTLAGWAAKLHPEDTEKVMATIEGHLKRSEPFISEYRVMNKEGEWRWWTARGTALRDEQNIPYWWIGSITDITERKLAEKTFQESEARYKTLVEHIPQKIFMKDRDYRWMSINENFARDLGISTEEIVGKLDHDLFSKELADKYHADDVRIITSGKTEELEEKYVVDGKETWVNTIKTPVRDDKGAVVGLLGIFWDITGRKLAEEEIRKLNTELEDRIVLRTAQLEATNKELEAFSYSVSHDLRAPLRHVSGYVELLNKRFQTDLPEKGQHYLNSIADSVHVMGALIDDLLQFSRTGRMEMRQSDCDMNEIVKEIIESLHKDNPDRKIEWVKGKLPTVYGDEAMLRLVWTNLLINAVKFTRTRKKARIEIGVRKENKELVFFVRDNGVGFDMKYAQKLFGVFQRLHPTEEFEGTGIGLANVQRIVLRHGGHTWAEAQPDKGAVFYFSIPNK